MVKEDGSISIKIIKSDETWKEFCFHTKITAFRDMVARKWGWDDDVQRQFCERDWLANPPRVILYGDDPIGIIGLASDDRGIEISQFCILPERQGQGIGTRVIGNILDEADADGVAARLSCLPDNPARALYERHGFKTVSEDETFLYMERKPKT